MNKIVINVAEDGYSEGLNLSLEAIVRGYEIGLFTKEEFEKNPNIYYDVPRHHPLLVQLIEDPNVNCSDDIWSCDLIVEEIDSDIYSIICDNDGSEKVITQNDKFFNWIKI